MRTPLDEVLFRLLDLHPEWSSFLSPEDAEMLLRRRQGASLKELAAQAGLTVAGVRLRLYGEGHGRVRTGGVLGRLRGLTRRERRAKVG